MPAEVFRAEKAGLCRPSNEHFVEAKNFTARYHYNQLEVSMT